MSEQKTTNQPEPKPAYSALDLAKVKSPTEQAEKQSAKAKPHVMPDSVPSSDMDPLPKQVDLSLFNDPANMTLEQARMILSMQKKARELVGPEPNSDGSGGKPVPQKYYIVARSHKVNWNGHSTVLNAGKLISEAGFSKQGILSLKRQGVILKEVTTGELQEEGLLS